MRVVGLRSWCREPGAWSVIEGGVEAPEAHVTVAPDHVVAVLTRGVPQTEADALLTVEGDEPLARGAMAVVAPLLTNK